jgi:hypothetical protein
MYGVYCMVSGSSVTYFTGVCFKEILVSGR